MNRFRLTIGGLQHGEYVLTVATKYSKMEVIKFFQDGISKLPEELHPDSISSEIVSISTYKMMIEKVTEYKDLVEIDLSEYDDDSFGLGPQEILIYLYCVIKYGGCEDLVIMEQDEIIIDLEPDYSDSRYNVCYE